MTPGEDLPTHTAPRSAWQILGFYFRSCFFKAYSCTSIFYSCATTIYNYAEDFCIIIFLKLPFWTILKAKPLWAGSARAGSARNSPGAVPQACRASVLSRVNRCSSATRENTHCRLVWTERLRLRNERLFYKRKKPRGNKEMLSTGETTKLWAGVWCRCCQKQIIKAVSFPFLLA